jgi:hypothetical protein
VCNTSVEVTLMDIDTDECVLLQGSDIVVQDSIIFFTVEKLVSNRHYNVTVMASSSGTPFKQWFSISEHLF